MATRQFPVSRSDKASTKIGRVNLVTQAQDAEIDLPELIDNEYVQYIWGYNASEGTINVEVRLGAMDEGDWVIITLSAGVPYRLEVLAIRKTNTDAEYVMVSN